MKKLIFIFTITFFIPLSLKAQDSNLQNPHEQYLTSLENKTDTKNFLAKEEEKIENKEAKLNQYQDFFNPSSSAFVNFNLRGNSLYEYEANPLIESELTQKNGFNKKATIDFGFNPNDYLGLYVTSSIGSINYRQNAPTNANQLNFNTKVEILKVGVTYDF